MNWAVIMAGGRGTRFWPESRNATPKQFLALFGSKTLLEQTADRLSGIVTRDRIVVVTQQSKTALVKRLLKIPSSQVIGEPVGRNTAPCMILAAEQILRKDPDAVISLLPSDHHIANPGIFKRSMKAAYQAARTTELPVTFGIRPSGPFTGYGYLEMGPVLQKTEGFPIHRLKAFHEKPSREKAVRFLKTGRFLWNSGMFVWRADRLLDAAREHLPEAYDLAVRIAGKKFEVNMKRLFPKMPNISIDYGLMEKMKGRILTLPVDFGWSDVGGWNALSELLSRDKDGNVCIGKSVLVRSSGNFVKSPRKLVALVGMKDFVVVDTPDALLVCPKSETESIRDVVEQLKKTAAEYL